MTTALSEDESDTCLSPVRRGTIDSDERELIGNIFEFNDRTALKIMTHRTDMVVIWEDDSEEEIMEKCTNRVIPLPCMRRINR